ncbi:SigE family RNA polymerase sigma factor [Micromonospora sp. NPDC048905]|uniref:SigE family RNA polymerase sigma factor n=1 Tax=Micromonospora sp. NPDC048905 TaxID=3155494 RepID=UPI0033C93B1C
MSGADRYAGFREFALTRGPALSRTAYLLVGDHQEAQDLLQEALAKTARHWRRVQAGGHPEAYVRTVMLNQLRSWRRRRRPTEVTSERVPDAASGDDLASDTAVRVTVACALATLPARQRAALYLRFYEDLSEVETDRLLGCSVGTVKRHVHDALVRLRQHIPSTPPTAFEGVQPSEVDHV